MAKYFGNVVIKAGRKEVECKRCGYPIERHTSRVYQYRRRTEGMVRAYTVQHAECFVDMLMQANAVIQAQPYTDERGNRPDLRFAVLQALKDNSDGITTDGLAASSGVPRPTVYRFLQDFTKIGLVDRRGEGTKAHPYVYFAARLPVSEKST